MISSITKMDPKQFAEVFQLIPDAQPRTTSPQTLTFKCESTADKRPIIFEDEDTRNQLLDLALYSTWKFLKPFVDSNFQKKRANQMFVVEYSIQCGKKLETPYYKLELTISERRAKKQFSTVAQETVRTIQFAINTDYVEDSERRGVVFSAGSSVSAGVEAEMEVLSTSIVNIDDNIDLFTAFTKQPIYFVPLAKITPLTLTIVTEQSKYQKTSKTKAYISYLAASLSSHLTHKGGSINCDICLQSLSTRKIKTITMNNCARKFHLDCVKAYVKSCFESSNLPIKCPEKTCNHYIGESIIASLVTDKELALFKKKVRVEKALRYPDKYVFCATTDCEHIYDMMLMDSPDIKLNCPSCLKSTCLCCRVTFHTGLTCDEYQDYTPEDYGAFQMICNQKWQKCWKCGFWVEKNEGCNHITCKCEYQFCYICGKVWKTCEH